MHDITSVSLVGSRTVFDERGHPYTVYELRTTTAAGNTWLVERRFSEFMDLSAQLSERHKVLLQNQTSADSIATVAPPEMPKNIRSAGWFGGNTLSQEFVRRREKGLHGWLQGVLAALPSDDELLIQALAPQNARRSAPSTPPAARLRGAPSPADSPDSSTAESPARPRPIHYASPYAYKTRPRAPLAWEVVWEAPAEAPATMVMEEAPALAFDPGIKGEAGAGEVTVT